MRGVADKGFMGKEERESPRLYTNMSKPLALNPEPYSSKEASPKIHFTPINHSPNRIQEHHTAPISYMFHPAQQSPLQVSATSLTTSPIMFQPQKKCFRAKGFSERRCQDYTQHPLFFSGFSASLDNHSLHFIIIPNHQHLFSLSPYLIF